MYRVVHGNPTQTPDAQEFIDLLNGLTDHSFTFARKLFNAEADLIVSRAPGRLDVMGGIADYSGSHVLEMPIAEATFVAAQRNEERTLRVVTLLVDEPRYDDPSHIAFTMPLTIFDGPIEYEAAREFFQRRCDRKSRGKLRKRNRSHSLHLQRLIHRQPRLRSPAAPSCVHN